MILCPVLGGDIQPDLLRSGPRVSGVLLSHLPAAVTLLQAPRPVKSDRYGIPLQHCCNETETHTMFISLYTLGELRRMPPGIWPAWEILRIYRKKPGWG